MSDDNFADAELKRRRAEEAFLHAVDEESDAYIDSRMSSAGIPYEEAAFEIERLYLECLSDQIGNRANIDQHEGEVRECQITGAVFALAAAELCFRLLPDEDRELALLNAADSAKRFPHSIVVRASEVMVSAAARRLRTMGLKDTDVKAAIVSAVEVALRPTADVGVATMEKQ